MQENPILIQWDDNSGCYYSQGGDEFFMDELSPQWVENEQMWYDRNLNVWLDFFIPPNERRNQQQHNLHRQNNNNNNGNVNYQQRRPTGVNRGNGYNNHKPTNNYSDAFAGNNGMFIEKSIGSNKSNISELSTNEKNDLLGLANELVEEVDQLAMSHAQQAGVTNFNDLSEDIRLYLRRQKDRALKIKGYSEKIGGRMNSQVGNLSIINNGNNNNKTVTIPEPKQNTDIDKETYKCFICPPFNTKNVEISQTLGVFTPGKAKREGIKTESNIKFVGIVESEDRFLFDLIKGTEENTILLGSKIKLVPTPEEIDLKGFFLNKEYLGTRMMILDKLGSEKMVEGVNEYLTYLFNSYSGHTDTLTDFFTDIHDIEPEQASSVIHLINEELISSIKFLDGEYTDLIFNKKDGVTNYILPTLMSGKNVQLEEMSKMIIGKVYEISYDQTPELAMTVETLTNEAKYGFLYYKGIYVKAFNDQTLKAVRIM